MRRFWNKLFGDRGERAAAKFLKQQGYTIVQRNYATAWGEIDIIALDKTTIVFVEVKTRQSIAYGQPEEAVTLEKQRILTRMALSYLKKHRLLDARARFDVVAVLWPEGVRTPEIRHLRNAFEPTSKWQLSS